MSQLYTRHDLISLIRSDFKVNRKCCYCKVELIEDCSINVQGGMYGINIIKKRKGLFKKVSAIPKAAICPECGNIQFYIDEYEKFKEL